MRLRSSVGFLGLLLCLAGPLGAQTASAPVFTWDLGRFDYNFTLGIPRQNFLSETVSWPGTGLSASVGLWALSFEQLIVDDMIWQSYQTIPLPATVRWNLSPWPWLEVGPRLRGEVHLISGYFGASRVEARGAVGGEARLVASLPTGYRPWVGVWGENDLAGRWSWGVSLEWSAVALVGFGAWLASGAPGL